VFSVSKKTREVPAASFKANCLRLMDEVARKRTPIVITKRGKPVAKLVPIDLLAATLVTRHRRILDYARQGHITALRA